MKTITTAPVNPIVAEIATDPIPIEIALETFGSDPFGDCFSLQAYSSKLSSRDYFKLLISNIAQHQPKLFFQLKRGLTDSDITISENTTEYLIKTGILVETDSSDIRFHPIALDFLFNSHIDDQINISQWKPEKINYPEHETDPEFSNSTYSDKVPFDHLIKKHGIAGALHESPLFTEYYLKTAKEFMPHLIRAIEALIENPNDKAAKYILKEEKVLSDCHPYLSPHILNSLNGGTLVHLDQFEALSFLWPELSSHPSANHLSESTDNLHSGFERYARRINSAISLLRTVKPEDFAELETIINQDDVSSVSETDFDKLLALHLVDYDSGEGRYKFTSHLKEALLLFKTELTEKSSDKKLPEETISSMASEELVGKKEPKEPEPQKVNKKIQIIPTPEKKAEVKTKPKEKKNKIDKKPQNVIEKFLTNAPKEDRAWKREDLVDHALKRLMITNPSIVENIHGDLRNIIKPNIFEELITLGAIEGNKFTLIAHIWFSTINNVVPYIEQNIEPSSTLTLPKSWYTANLDLESNPKGLLFEFVQLNKLKRPSFKVESSGELHAIRFKGTVSLEISGNVYIGQGHQELNSRKNAEQEASRDLLKVLLRLVEDNPVAQYS